MILPLQAIVPTSLWHSVMLLCRKGSHPASWGLCQDKMGPNKWSWLSHQSHLCLHHLWLRGIGTKMHDWWCVLFCSVCCLLCFVFCVVFWLETRVSKWIFLPANTLWHTHSGKTKNWNLGLSSNYSLKGNPTLLDRGSFLHCAQMLLSRLTDLKQLCQMLHVN